MSLHPLQEWLLTYLGYWGLPHSHLPVSGRQGRICEPQVVAFGHHSHTGMA